MVDVPSAPTGPVGDSTYQYRMQQAAMQASGGRGFLMGFVPGDWNSNIVGQPMPGYLAGTVKYRNPVQPGPLGKLLKSMGLDLAEIGKTFSQINQAGGVRDVSPSEVFAHQSSIHSSTALPVGGGSVDVSGGYDRYS